MDPEDVELVAAVQAASAAARRRERDHPSTDELLAYYEGTLSAAAKEALRDHLAVCPPCAERALDVAALASPEDDEDDDSSVDQGGDGWPGLRDKLEEAGLLADAKEADAAETPAAGGVSPLPGVSRTRFASLGWAYAMAALFFLTSLALGVLLARDLQTVVGGTSPKAGFSVRDLDPIEIAQRTGVDAVRGIEARPDGVVLILNAVLLEAETADRYRLEIFDRAARGRPVRWSRDDLERDSEGYFTLEIPGGWLAAGAYGVDLRHPDGRLLRTYHFDLEPPPPP